MITLPRPTREVVHQPTREVVPRQVMGDPAGKHAKRRLDLADVVGQLEAKWACDVAAAGRHHMLFHGPPGVGKTMLAERVPGLLPDLDLHDSLEVSAVHSLGSTWPMSSSPDRPTATHTIRHRLPASSAVVSGWPGPVQSHAHMRESPYLLCEAPAVA
jgi:predicted ATPase with chaperone activity